MASSEPQPGLKASVTIPLEIRKAIEPACDAFEEEWAQGETPDLAQFVAECGDPERSWLFQELLRIDLAYRRKSGETPKPADYHARFSGDLALIDTVFKESDPTALELSATHSIQPRALEDTGPMEKPAAPRPALRGSFGDFELLESLGEGGMGIVYRARQQGMQRDVALKLIRTDRLGPTDTAHRQAAIKRFLSERELAAQLEHEHIVRVYHVGELDDQPYFVMQLIHGTSLHQRLRDGPLDSIEAARLLQPAVRAVEHAHHKDIIHRDIKPRNILLDENGKPYLADFGLAKSLEVDEGLTETGELLGTAPYMSPEQATGRAVGPASDVYSLGATLYEMVTGRPPFRAATFVETIRQVLDEEPVAPRRLNPAVSRDVETICLKCLEKDPRNRYPTAEALAADLAHVEAGEPITVRPISRTERLWRWCKRNPRLAVSSAAASLLALALAIGGPSAALVINQQKQVAVQAKGEAEASEEKAIEAQRRAELQREIAVDSLRTLLYEAHPILVNEPGMQDLRKTLLDIAIGGLEEVERINESDEKEALLMASSYRKLGELCLDIGESDRARVFYGLALNDANRLHAEGRLPDPHFNFANLYHDLGEVERRSGNVDAARDHFLNLLDHREALRSEREDLATLRGVAEAHMRLYQVSLIAGDLEAAHEHLQENRRLLDQDPNRQFTGRDWAGELASLSRHRYEVVGDLQSAREYASQCLEVLQAAAATEPDAPNIHADLALKYSWCAYLSLVDGDVTQARLNYEKAIDGLQEISHKDPQNATITYELASAHYGMGNTCLSAEDRKTASEHYNEARRFRQQLVGRAKDNAQWQADYMLALVRCGNLDTAGRIAADLRAKHAGNPWVLLNIACAEALMAAAIEEAPDFDPGEKRSPDQHYQNALSLVRSALDLGFESYSLLRYDPDLSPLQGRADFEALLAQSENGTLQPE